MKDLNKCNSCGKFKKWADLIYMAGDSDDVGNFPEWFDCIDCAPKSDLDRHNLIKSEIELEMKNEQF